MALLALLALLLSEAAAVKLSVNVGDMATLNCSVSTDRIRAVEWLKDEQPPKFILFYRDGHLDPDHQDSSFRDRVELVDREFKGGDVSLRLKNVIVADTGTYNCLVAAGNSRRTKRAYIDEEPVGIIHLEVTGPQRENEGNGRVFVGTAAALALLVVAVGAVVAGLKYRRPRDGPPAEEAAGQLFVSPP